MPKLLVVRPPLAHVNGVLTGIRNDGGIVELASGPYILVILLDHQMDATRAENAIATASAEVFATVNQARGATSSTARPPTVMPLPTLPPSCSRG